MSFLYTERVSVSLVGGGLRVPLCSSIEETPKGGGRGRRRVQECLPGGLPRSRSQECQGWVRLVSGRRVPEFSSRGRGISRVTVLLVNS